MRGLTLEWAAGLFGVVVGGLMLIAPDQFRIAIYGDVAPQPWWGIGLLVSGCALIGLRLISRSRPLVVSSHLLAGGALLLFAAALAPSRVWTGTVAYWFLGFGTAVAPFLPARPSRVRPIDLFIVVAGLVTVTQGGLMLTVPEAFSSPIYARLVPHLPSYGLASVISGAVLLATEFDSRASPRAQLVARLASVLICAAMLVLVVLPAGYWTGLVYWGGSAAILATSVDSRRWWAHLNRVPRRVQAAVLLASLTALVVVLALAVERERTDDVILEQQLAQQTVLARGTGAAVADWLAWQQSAIALLAAHPNFDTLTPAEQATAMLGVQATYPALQSFAYYDAAGRITARAGGGLGPRRLRRDVFEQAREGQTRPVSAGAWQRDDRHGSFVVGAPVAHADGQFGGVIVAVGDLATLVDVMRRSAPDEMYDLYLLDAAGQPIAPPAAAVSSTLAAQVRQAAEGELRTVEPIDPAGERLVGFAAINGLPWKVVVELPPERGVAAISAVNDLMLRVILGGVLLAAAGAALIATRLRGPVDRQGPLAPGPEPWQVGSAARDSNETLSALVRASPLAVIVTDARATVIAWNPAAERLFGWRIDEALGRPVAEFFEHPIQDVVATADDTARVPIDIRRRTRANELVEAAVWAAPLGRAPGLSGGLLLILADIAERKRLDEERARLVREQTARREAFELQRRLAFLAEASAELNVSLDFEATIQTAVRVAVPDLADWCVLDLLDADGGVHSVAGPSVDAATADALREFWQRRRPARQMGSAMCETLATREGVLLPDLSVASLRGVNEQPFDSAEIELFTRLAPVSAIAMPLLGRDHPLGVMTFMAVRGRRTFDATDLALAEALVRRCAVAIENARLYREAQDALRARDTFLSIASHELGSPLARVKAYAEVLLMAQSNQQLDERLLNRSLRSIDRATGRLTKITQDLFDVSRLRIGDLQLRRLRLNFAQLLRDVTRNYADELDERHQLKVRISRGSYPVEIDPDRMEQVLDNLLRNAVKYSPDGGAVFVTLRREGEGVLLIVRDEGIGLPPGAADVIFEPFGRAANAERRKLPGMGLGLYICRSIVERHHGRIWADSPGEHKGMSISVWLPLAG